jgi:transcriptional regulator with XRE-family HTH domain
MTVAERFTANLLAARKAAGLSQEEMSFRAEIHRTEVSQLERGLRVPRIDTVAKLCGALEVEFAALLEGIRWRVPTRTGGGFEDGQGSAHPDPSPGR